MDIFLISRIPGKHEADTFAPDFEKSHTLVETRDMGTFSLERWEK